MNGKEYDMILTGRAEAHFWYWIDNSKRYNSVFRQLIRRWKDHVLIHGLIVEWLDGVGYHVTIQPHIGGGADVYYAKVIYRDSNFIDTWDDVENTDYNPTELYFSTRQEATKQAILKANHIYNER